MFPNEKSEIELLVVRHYFMALAAAGIDLYQSTGEPRQNQESGLDFELPTRQGSASLELMEVAVFSGVSQYQSVPNTYFAAERVRAIHAAISKKARRYGQHQVTPIHLLLYSTDWRFGLSRPEAALLAEALRRSEHPFATVVHFFPAEPDHGLITELHPNGPAAEQLAGDPERIVVSHVNPTQPEWAPEGQSFMLDLEGLGFVAGSVRTMSMSVTIRKREAAAVVAGVTIIVELNDRYEVEGDESGSQ